MDVQGAWFFRGKDVLLGHLVTLGKVKMTGGGSEEKVVALV